MGIFDNIRAASRALIGTATAHEAAESSRRLKGWPTTDTELNTLIRNAGNTLRQRSRHLIATNGYAVNAQEGFAAHLVGAGRRPGCQVMCPDFHRRTEVLGRTIVCRTH